jgi:tetratricopeptide (TPR) repeat protein
MRKGDILRYRGELDASALEYQKLKELQEPLPHIIGIYGTTFLHYLKGQYEDVRREWTELAEFVQRFSQPRWNSRKHIEFADLDLRTGRYQESVEHADESFAIAAAIGYRQYMQRAFFQKGRAQVRIGSLDDAEQTADELKTLVEEGRNQRTMRWYEFVAGEIALAKGEHALAIELFRQSIARLEYGPLTHDAFYIEALARAFYASGDLESAQREYERITGLVRGRDGNGDTYAKSFYMLGRIYEQQGEAEGAIENYDRFLELWKDADPCQEEVEDARARVAALRQ